MTTRLADPPATSAPGAPRARSAASLLTEDLLTKATAPVGLLVICLVFSILSPRFLTADNIGGMLADASLPILLALGATFVVALAGIDLSLAATVALGSVAFGIGYERGLPLLVCCLLSVATGLVVGLFNGAVVGWVRIPDFIVTLGTMSLVMGTALVVSGGTPIEVNNSFFTTISTESVGIFRYNLLIALAVAAGAHVLLNHTRFGTHLLATGGNTEAARAMGIRVGRVKLAGYALCGLLAGSMSVLLIAYVGSTQPAANTDYLLKAIAAVVLGGVSLFGGRATIWGPVVGAILLTVLQDGLILLGVSAFYEPIVVGAVVIVAASLMRSRR
ncbi:ABC transporter permease [Phytohabitans suffuscus]|uniref:ABC transporter permease n=1 Tax=Phytohabitans suffuscus TaxID=624315 RepID=A0A6F8Z1J2_9ACTN|nr:ABC transporter permease [Phytohabitans suffuscus]